MQVPKILGGTTGKGELLELTEHILDTVPHMNWLALLLGVVTFAAIQILKRIIPKFPMAVVMMFAGVAATVLFHIEDYGVRLLSSVEPGLPKLFVPSFAGIDMGSVLTTSLTVAVVVMAETLLSENNFAFKNHYKITENREILACAAGNIAAGLAGCCPVNGSISRTSMNDQFGGKTQVVSLAAGVTMVVILLSCTGFIGYLPVPVLAAIVVSALMNVVEFHLARRLFKVSRSEFYIFMAAFMAVLLFGTIYGVGIGIVLSFAEFVLKAANPSRDFLGVIPGREGFFELRKNEHAYALKNTVIYRFRESLFFANIKIFMEDIENSIDEHTQNVIVDAGAVTDIDITAADQLEALAQSLKERGIRFFMTEHMASVNEQMRRLGIGHLIEDGMVRRTMTSALRAAGMTAPYPLEEIGEVHMKNMVHLAAEEENSLEEFAWAFGDDVVRQIEKKVKHVMDSIHYMPDVWQLANEGLPRKADAWEKLGAIDEDEILRRLELHLDELPKELTADKRVVLSLIEKRRRAISDRMSKENPEVYEKLKKSREKLEKRLKKQNPEAAKKIEAWVREAKKDND